jgi:hypothetical protein
VPLRDLRHHRAGRQRFLDDPHLIVARPATAPLNPAQNLYPASTDLKASLKATCFVGNLPLNKAAYRGGIRRFIRNNPPHSRKG